MSLTIGQEIWIRLEPSRNRGLTALHLGVRVFVERRDEQLHHPEPGQYWKARVTCKLDNDLWRVTLICRGDSSACMSIAPENRHLGEGTPAHLEHCLRTLPDQFDVIFEFEDDKSVFGIWGGLVIRPVQSDRPPFDRRFRVTPYASGARGIYVQIIETIHRATLPDRFQVAFDRRDVRGVHGYYSGFIIRPDSNWLPPPALNQTVEVSAITLLTVRTWVAFVEPAR